MVKHTNFYCEEIKQLNSLWKDAVNSPWLQVCVNIEFFHTWLKCSGHNQELQGEILWFVL